MAGWEYQVIHINVEPPRPQGPPPAADGAATTPPVAGESSGGKPMFSDTFLKKEFPQFYQKPPSEGSASQAQHPAHQLQTFLNGHGAQGWELIGVFPVGNLTMMFFRRSKHSEPKPTRPAQEPAAMKPAMASELAMAPPSAMGSASAMGSDSASGPAAEATDNATAREGTLHEFLRRLEQIEERLRVREVAGEGPTPPGRPARPPRDAGSAQTSAGRAGGSLPGQRPLKAGRPEARSGSPRRTGDPSPAGQPRRCNPAQQQPGGPGDRPALRRQPGEPWRPLRLRTGAQQARPQRLGGHLHRFRHSRKGGQ